MEATVAAVNDANNSKIPAVDIAETVFVSMVIRWNSVVVIDSYNKAVIIITIIDMEEELNLLNFIEVIITFPAVLLS